MNAHVELLASIKASIEQSSPGWWRPELRDLALDLIKIATDLSDSVEVGLSAHARSVERFDGLCMGIMRIAAEGGSLRDVVQRVAETMDACDAVDDESIALYQRALEASSTPRKTPLSSPDSRTS